MSGTSSWRYRGFSSTGRSAVVVVVVVLAAAACGGSGGGRLTKSEYESKLGALGSGLTGDLAAFAAVDPNDLKAAPAFLRRVADTLDRFAASLSSIQPPLAVAGQHARLITGARSGAREIRGLAGRLETADEARAKALLARFSPSRLHGLRELESAAAEMAAKGYRISSTADT